MEFFNQKEDVIDIELTPFGEHLLSLGVFKPTYYSFHDEDILYDAEYAGTIEPQNNIKKRIKDEVPRLKPQAVFKGVDAPIYEHPQKKGSPIPHTGGDLGWVGKFDLEQQYIGGIEQTELEKHYTFSLPLGNSSFDTEYAPAWDIKFLYGSVASSVSFLSTTARAYLKIPQIDAVITYNSFVKDLDAPDKGASKLRNPEYEELHDLPEYGDNTTYDFDEEFIILEINEHNVPYQKDNFEIEVFEIKDITIAGLGGAGQQVKIGEELISLSFAKPPSQTKDGLLMSFEEQALATEKDLQAQFLDLDDTYVEHFINVYVDKEIDPELICKVKPVVKQKGIFVDDPLDCTKELTDEIPISKIYPDIDESDSLPECE